jgi:hypothetical protein
VLVVHNDHATKTSLKRPGNESDVRNLRRVFTQRRNCKLVELKNCGSDRILQVLKNQSELCKLFQGEKIWHDNFFQIKFAAVLWINCTCLLANEGKLLFIDDATLADPPELFYFFFLAHGYRKKYGEMILADENEHGSNAEGCSSYATREVWEALSTIQIIAEIPKILFFAVIIV